MRPGKIIDEQNGWQTISRQTHFDDGHLELVTEFVRTPNASTGRKWTTVHRKAAVVVAPMLPNGDLVLIRQERIPVRAAIWEMPAGQIDERHDFEAAAVEAVALRELKEEAGYQLVHGGELIPLGHFFSSPGFTDEHAFLFLARHVEVAPEGHAHTESESIVDCRSFSPREIARLITNGEIRDANTLATCARMVAAGLLSFYA
ncbi:MAG: NUDIX hydrolase [Verrucomicrobiaceae bacterium]|nr:NUDIX hydrolase [Verrucomicrobiaceae bacterium]